MKETREFAMCGQLPDGKIVVTGGITKYSLTKSTEIYDPILQQWTSGPELPLYWYQGKMVKYMDTLLLVNGWAKTYSGEDNFATQSILQYTNDAWIEFPKKLPSPRSNAVVFLADGDLLTENCKITRNSATQFQRLSVWNVLFLIMSLLFGRINP